VFIEGKIVFSGLDIFKETGGYSALVKKTSVTVSDGALTIQFGQVRENAKISAIEVHRISTSTVSSPPATIPSNDAIYRINMGGGNYVDKSGNTWSADNFYNGGGEIEKWVGGSTDIRRTNDDKLYQLARFDPPTQPELKYELPVQSGEYLVVMHWAETYDEIKSAGQRVFDVFIEGKKVLSRLDIFAEGGGRRYTAVKKSAIAQVNDGKLTISFGKIRENAKLNALEVFPTKTSLPSSSSSPQDQGNFPLYINAGGNALTDSTGISWIKDSFFNGGKVENAIGSPKIVGAADSSIYLTARYDLLPSPSLKYEIPCPNGEYSLIFHWSEIYEKAFRKGARIFSVKIEDKMTLNNIDIYEESGGKYSALIKTASTTVNDGVLSIEFIHGVENPKISAIEVHKGRSTTTVSSPLELPGQSVYINAGDKEFKDSNGIIWMADTYYNTGEEEPIALGDIKETNDDGLFSKGRYVPKTESEPLKYEIPVASNGVYDVTLFFAETYGRAMQAGIRVFDVSINGSKKFEKVDIYGETKAGYKALKKTATVSVTNKIVTILFGRIAENPKINAIQVTPSSGQPAYPPTESSSTTNVASRLPIRINSGGKAFTDNAGNLWAEDSFYGNSGQPEQLWNPVTTIYGTADDQLYMTGRFDDSPSQPALVYDIPVPNTEIEVTLHFAELYSKAMYKGARVFDVSINGSRKLNKLDIYAEAGGFTALKKTIDVKVNNGMLSIAFTHGSENPKVRMLSQYE